MACIENISAYPQTPRDVVSYENEASAGSKGLDCKQPFQCDKQDYQ
jgi:hypothetical protein